jgi:hypothetical protein
MRTIGLACVAVAAGLAAAWTITAPEQSRAATVASPILTEVTADDLKSILTEWGASDFTPVESRPIKGQDGAVAITIRRLTFKHSGLGYEVRMYCLGEGAGCLGIQVMVAFEKGSVTQSVLNSYNANFRAGKAYLEEQALVSERYIIVDHGIARANILTQLVVHESVSANMLNYIKENGVIASAPTPGAPVPVALPLHLAKGSTVHLMPVKDLKAPLNRLAP